jgi:ATP-dependent exoDNAse (exonuclease V) alpha subunit
LSYEVGDVVQAEIDYASLGLKRGDTARVVARLDHRVLLEREDGKQVAWQPANSTRLSAFVPEAQRLNEGDLVRVTANNRSRGLVNGDLARVTGFDAEGRITITLANGAVVWLDAGKPLTLDYGYCSTVYASQGQTCEKVMIEADAYSLTASQNTFYVALSRARQNVSIYTDDREMLPLAMSREMDKASALDLAPKVVEMER